MSSLSRIRMRMRATELNWIHICRIHQVNYYSNQIIKWTLISCSSFFLAFSRSVQALPASWSSCFNFCKKFVSLKSFRYKKNRPYSQHWWYNFPRRVEKPTNRLRLFHPRQFAAAVMFCSIPKFFIGSLIIIRLIISGGFRVGAEGIGPDQGWREGKEKSRWITKTSTYYVCEYLFYHLVNTGELCHSFREASYSYSKRWFVRGKFFSRGAGGYEARLPIKGWPTIAQYYLSFRYKSTPTDELKYTKVSLQLQESTAKGGSEEEIRFLE